MSGGTYVILQHASYMRKNGHEVVLAIQEPFSNKTYAWHDEASSLHCLPIDEAKALIFDLVIATWWKTAFELCNFESKSYAYFVQSIESRFYSADEQSLRALVESTYQYPLHYLTEATWIKKYLSQLYAVDATLVRNGIRKDVYSTMGNVIADRHLSKPRVLIEGHFGVSFKNTALGIRLAKEAGAKDIWVLTGSKVSWLPGVNRVFSQVPIFKTAEIYRSCDILIKLSTVEGMFGPPLEQFHCGGTAIVFDVSGHDEYIINKVNAVVVPSGDMDCFVNTLTNLLNNSSEIRRLQTAATITANAWPSWESASEKFEQWTNLCLSKPNANRVLLRELTDLAFRTYSENESRENNTASKTSFSTKFRRFAINFPPKLKLLLKHIEAPIEVIFGKRKVY